MDSPWASVMVPVFNKLPPTGVSNNQCLTLLIGLQKY
ncbi:hypothetical protein SLEP1_g10917 [Rubroshorea leprosula]|uniref:Uncharacterized protein n=1 Tax=Rubroshorea leprosula TaxID=152421 RepID=A0AAV5IHK1_9ROSI|nr:hypothetical protein SLEP1_g10917 [Rubroshorea leprosula]